MLATHTSELSQHVDLMQAKLDASSKLCASHSTNPVNAARVQRVGACRSTQTDTHMALSAKETDVVNTLLSPNVSTQTDSSVRIEDLEQTGAEEHEGETHGVGENIYTCTDQDVLQSGS